MTAILMNILWIGIALLAAGTVLYLIYGMITGCVTVTRLIFKGLIDLVTLKSLRQEVRKFKG